MKDQILLALAKDTLQQRYGDGETALSTLLHLPIEALEAPELALSGRQRDHLRYLFTDYEWMLAEKVAVLDESDPSEAGIAVRFQQAKAAIAKAWLQSALLHTRYVKEPLANGRVAMHLQLRLDYGEHGLVDILDFVVPAHVAKQVANEKIDLLTWVAGYLDAPTTVD